MRFANELADPNFSLSVPEVAKATIRKLLTPLGVANTALDIIATRVTDDDYDNPSSALEAIGNAVESTGRVIVQHEY